MDKFLITRKAYNRKTGPIMVTTSPRASCPDACPLRRHAKGDLAGACYAEHGFLAGYVWHNLDRLPIGASFKKGQIKIYSFEELLTAIRALPAGSLWRHNQAGDLPSNDQRTINRAKLRRLVEANHGRRGFTYTHFDVLGNRSNRKAVREANDKGFTVNLSADSLRQADVLADLAIAPVTAVVPSDMKKNGQTPAGRAAVICPAVINKRTTCATCGLCATKRKAIIAFPAIGRGGKKFVG